MSNMRRIMSKYTGYVIFAPIWWTALAESISGILRSNKKTLRDQLNLKICENDFQRFSETMLICVENIDVLEKGVTNSVNL